MKILIDLDGIVTDTLPVWLKEIQRKTGVEATESDINRWDLSTCHPLNSIAPQKIWDILEQPGFYYNLPFIPGAKEALERLNKTHEIYLVTARMGHHGYSETHRWMEDFLPFLKKEQLVFCPKKDLIPADVIIDDKAETLAKYTATHENAVYMGIRYEYNKSAWNDQMVFKYPKKLGITPWSKLEKLIKKAETKEFRLKYKIQRAILLKKALDR